MTGQASEIQWYIARDGKQHGPLTDIEMRTFVAHSYLRTSDLIWRPGMAEWLAAPVVFPTAFEAQGDPQAAQPAQTAAPRTNTYQTSAPVHATQQSKPASAARDAHSSDFDVAPEPRPKRSLVKRLAFASVAITVIGGGALAVAAFRQPLIDMVSRSQSATGETPPVVSAPTQMKIAQPQPEPSAAPPSADLASSQPTPPASQTTTSSVSSGSAPSPDVSDAAQNAPNQQVAAIDATPPAPPPPTIDGSPVDAKLQKVPVWVLIKKEYPDWYASQVTAANKLVADKRTDNEVAMLLAQGLVNLRRQNSEKALEASSEKLQQVAVAFLEHLKSLRAQSVSACFGFISKGETSPAAVQMMENPESATALNAQADAVFEAISEGTRNPVKHDSAVKSDYDILIKELSKLGWKEEDLQVFSNPKLLAKREPEQVCKMVQEWFVAHLAVPDKAVRDRLLFETLKPVVSG